MLSLPASLCARDLAAAAQAEYRQCLKDTAEAARSCSFGGCGNIQASCYQRQQAVFDAATERVAGTLRTGRCAPSAQRLDEDIAALAARTAQVPELASTYAGLALQVRLAEFRNQAFGALAAECGPARDAAAAPAQRPGG